MNATAVSTGDVNSVVCNAGSNDTHSECAVNGNSAESHICAVNDTDVLFCAMGANTAHQCLAHNEDVYACGNGAVNVHTCAVNDTNVQCGMRANIVQAGAVNNSTVPTCAVNDTDV